MLCLKGLIVVDAFQAWCGPCKTVVDLFRKIRNEVSSDLLHFAVAEVDSIDALEKYRGKCEPVFLFYAVSDDLFTVVAYRSGCAGAGRGASGAAGSSPGGAGPLPACCRPPARCRPWTRLRSRDPAPREPRPSRAGCRARGLPLRG
uniref:Thioredoxin domain-containing protein n=1 Tax=Anas platyrhynchos platyrhynchos TaxID=8840 RepID=U3I785_ANAPP